MSLAPEETRPFRERLVDPARVTVDNLCLAGVDRAVTDDLLNLFEVRLDSVQLLCEDVFDIPITLGRAVTSRLRPEPHVSNVFRENRDHRQPEQISHRVVGKRCDVVAEDLHLLAWCFAEPPFRRLLWYDELVLIE